MQQAHVRRSHAENCADAPRSLSTVIDAHNYNEKIAVVHQGQDLLTDTIRDNSEGA